MSHWASVTPGQCHIGPVSHWARVTPGQCHIGPVSHQASVTLGQSHIGPVSHWASVTPGPCHSGPVPHSASHIGPVSHWASVTLGQQHTQFHLPLQTACNPHPLLPNLTLSSNSHTHTSKKCHFSLGLALSSSRTTSLAISSWRCFLTRSFNRSRCSSQRSFLYRCTKVSKLWCHSTGNSRSSLMNLEI